jgi:GTP-binding protein YchF
MEFGILGLELSGKTTLFSLLTGHHLAVAPGKRESHVGVAHVPDQRLERLAAVFAPRKAVTATVRFVDVPALARGAGGSLNLPELRTADGLAAVVRGFSSPTVPHPEGSVAPARDLELLETELLLADLTVVGNRLHRLDAELKKHQPAELLAERTVLERCRGPLEAGRPLRGAGLSPEDRQHLKGFGLLTLKPMLAVLNADEAAAADLAEALTGSGLTAWQERPGLAACAVCATLEEEIARLEPADQAAFLAELGLPDRALDRLLRAAYELLGLVAFFTVGDEEVRAWSVPAGTHAVGAAGAVHSDFERGFIRAEVVPWQELTEAGSFAACRTHGTLRLEGRDYVVRDGDVITFRFNV